MKAAATTLKGQYSKRATIMEQPILQKKYYGTKAIVCIKQDKYN